MRQSKNENYMEHACVAAKRSHDTETQVGAVLVNSNSGAIIATGFNGFVRGARDEDLPTRRPEKYEYIVHAEVNLIANCARNGINTNGCIVYCTLSPCKACMRLLYNCGITKVIVKELYRDFEDIKSMKDIEVSVDGSENEPFITIKYETR